MRVIIFCLVLVLMVLSFSCDSTVDENEDGNKVETRRIVNREHFMNLEDDSILVYAFTDELDFLQNSGSHQEKMEAIATLTKGQQHLLLSIVVLLAHRHGSWDYFINFYSLGHDDKDALWKSVKDGLVYLQDDNMLEIFNKVLNVYYDDNIEGKNEAYKSLDGEFDNTISLSIKNAADFVKANPKEFVIFEDEI